MRGYDTVAYAKSRLVETIVRREKVPVLILDVGGTDSNITIFYNELLGEKSHIKEAPLSEFNLDPVSLGYVNHKGYAHYLMRTPMRRDWRQGLRMLNIVDAEGMNPRLISYKSIAQTILGNFPTFKSSLTALTKEKVSSIAFHKDFSINKQGVLTHKGMFPIGAVDISNGNVMINDNTNWVREAFEEAMELAG